LTSIFNNSIHSSIAVFYLKDRISMKMERENRNMAAKKGKKKGGSKKGGKKK